jgi:hypothetical protein
VAKGSSWCTIGRKRPGSKWVLTVCAIFHSNFGCSLRMYVVQERDGEPWDEGNGMTADDVNITDARSRAYIFCLLLCFAFKRGVDLHKCRQKRVSITVYLLPARDRYIVTASWWLCAALAGGNCVFC